VLERGRVTSIAPCQRFVARAGNGAVLHLHLPVGVRVDAMRSLQAGGFSPQLNGVGVLVPVAPEQKAGPFRVLADARIPIDDFELVSNSHAANLAAAHSEVKP